MMTKLHAKCITLLPVLLGLVSTAMAQNQNVYTQDGWEAYQYCLETFEGAYQQELLNKVLICGWDRDTLTAYWGTGEDLATITARELNNCAQRSNFCVVFAQNYQFSTWAQAASEGRRTFFQQGRQ
jgi:hypothetical protein